MRSHDHPFKPITIQPVQNQQGDYPPDIKLEEYNQLMRMKKMLVQTQQKMENRINLFRKASQKIIKQRQKEVSVFNKIQLSKHYRTLSETPAIRKALRTADSSHKRYQKQPKQVQEDKHLLDQLFLHRVNNARELKKEKAMFRTIIEERRKMQLQRKLQSAKDIRKRRENVKIVKQNLWLDRKEAIKRGLLQKCKKEREQFIQLQRLLSSLQDQEQKALLQWKKTRESQF